MMKRSNVFLSSIAAMCVWAGNAQAAVLETNEWSNRTQANWIYNTSTIPSIDSDTDTPSGGSALRHTYRAGTYATSTGGGRAVYTNLTGSDLYVGHWMKWSPNFVWNSIGTKIDYMKGSINSNRTGGLPYLTIRVQPGGVGMALDVGIQQDRGTHTVYNNRGTTPFALNTWYWIEFHAKLNTCLTCPDNGADGIFEVWVNDVLQMQYTNLKYIDKPDAWRYLEHSPEWGGSGGRIPAEQYYWVDHTVISTTRIGRPGSPSRTSDTTAPLPPSNFKVN